MRLIERLEQSFDTARPDEAQAYLATLRDEWREISSALTRNAWIIALLIAAFELAAHRGVSAVTFGPFAISNLNYVRLFIPAVVSYLLYEEILLVARWIETEATHTYLIGMVWPEIEQYDFDALLSPRLPALSNLVHSYSPASATLSRSIRAIAQYVLALLVLFSILAFDAFAFAELRSQLGPTNPIFWVNVAVTAALVMLSLVVLALWLVEERLVW
jgi:hypothetical protein